MTSAVLNVEIVKTRLELATSVDHELSTKIDMMIDFERSKMVVCHGLALLPCDLLSPPPQSECVLTSPFSFTHKSKALATHIPTL